MNLAKLIEAGLIKSAVPDEFHDDVIHQIMSAIDDEIKIQLRSNGKADLLFEGEILLGDYQNP
jgi:hypothetical protein